MTVSTDKTAAILDKMDNGLNVHVIHLPENVGKRKQSKWQLVSQKEDFLSLQTATVK